MPGSRTRDAFFRVSDSEKKVTWLRRICTGGPHGVDSVGGPATEIRHKLTLIMLQIFCCVYRLDA